MRLSYALAITSTLYCAAWLAAGPEPDVASIALLASVLLAASAALWFWERSRT